MVNGYLLIPRGLRQHLEVADVAEVETLDFKASILLLLNALQILAAFLIVEFLQGDESVSLVALAPSRATCEKRDDDLAPHADDALSNRDSAALEGLGIGELHEGRGGWDFVRVYCGGVVRCHVFKIPQIGRRARIISIFFELFFWGVSRRHARPGNAPIKKRARPGGEVFKKRAKRKALNSKALRARGASKWLILKELR